MHTYRHGRGPEGLKIYESSNCIIIESLAIRNFVLSLVVIDGGLYSMSREKGFYNAG